MDKRKVISLDLAKEIAEVTKEKGVKLPGSEYFWYQYDTNPPEIVSIVQVHNDIKSEEYVICNAYDTFELFEMLPKSIKRSSWLYDFNIEQNKKTLKYYPSYSDEDIPYGEVGDKSIVKALGKMLLYLLKNNLYK